MKTKKTGICRREIITEAVKDSNGNVIEKAELGKLSLTDGDTRSAIRSALRRLWNSSRQRVFLEEVRFKATKIVQLKHGPKEKEFWAVKCAFCERQMGMSEKDYRVSEKTGKRSKNKKSVFDVDHVHGNPTFEDIEQDLGAWAHNLFCGELRILCIPCHTKRTKEQRNSAGRQ